MNFNLKKIKQDLDVFRDEFKNINDILDMRREDFTDIHISNIMEGYTFLNDLLEREINLFSQAGMYHMLELNHIVLCGTDPKMRFEHYKHLVDTRDVFTKGIRPISEWLTKQLKKKNRDPYDDVSGFYTRALSFPQLFIEGNHRTENMIINYYLAGQSLPPFIITPDKAKEYLDISGHIKFSRKKDIKGDFKRNKYNIAFKKFISEQGDASYLKKKEK